MKKLRQITTFFLFSIFSFVMIAGTDLSAQSLKAPDFTAKDIHGNDFNFSDYAGKTKVLYFWATWCPACRNETAPLQEMMPFLKEKNVEFIHVSLDTDLSRIQAYAEENKLTDPILFDGKGWKNEIAETFGVSSTPSFFIIGPENQIIVSGSWHKQLQKFIEMMSEN
jgi:peroxiredoxin